MKPKTEDLKQQPESFPRSSLYRHYYMIIQIVFAVVFFSYHNLLYINPISMNKRKIYPE